MITATDLEVRAGARTLLSIDGAALRVAAGRPHRTRRTKRRWKDHDHAHPRRRGRALRRQHHADRRDRLPAAGSQRGQPRHARPRPGSLGTRSRHPACGSGEATGVDGRGRRRCGPRPCGSQVRPARGAVFRTRRIRRRERGRSHLRESRPAGPRPHPVAAHPLRRSAPPRRALPHPVRRIRHRIGVVDDAASRRTHQPPRRRLARLAPRVPQGTHRRARGDQPQRRPARRRRQPGVVPRCRAQ